MEISDTIFKVTTTISVIVLIYFAASALIIALKGNNAERRIRFWTKLRARATTQLIKYQDGTRCPNCLRWTWEMERPAHWTETKTATVMRCGTCSHRSHWLAGPGVMIPVRPMLAPPEFMD